jgi:hypothetical protein
MLVEEVDLQAYGRSACSFDYVDHCKNVAIWFACGCFEIDGPIWSLVQQVPQHQGQLRQSASRGIKLDRLVEAAPGFDLNRQETGREPWAVALRFAGNLGLEFGRPGGRNDHENDQQNQQDVDHRRHVDHRRRDLRLSRKELTFNMRLGGAFVAVNVTAPDKDAN